MCVICEIYVSYVRSMCVICEIYVCCMYVVCLTYNTQYWLLCASQIIFGKIYPLEAAFPYMFVVCLAYLICRTQIC